MNSRPQKEPSWLSALLWFLGGVGLLVAVPVGAQVRANQQQAEWDAGTGTATVQISGVMSGDSYSLSSVAVAHTDAEYGQTTLRIEASRIETRWNSRTPAVVVTFPDVALKCGTARNYVWSTRTGSTLTLLCDRYVTLEDLDTLGAGIVESA